MFGVRLKSSIVLMVITIITIVLGGNVLFGVILGISLIGMTELYKIKNLQNTVLGYIGYLGCIISQVFLLLNHSDWNMFLINGVLIVLMGAYVITFPKFKITDIAIVFLGLFYVGFMLSYIYQVRMLHDGAYLVWLIFIGAWGSDTCAYVVGITIGKTKFLPKLSPNKSLEGCIGGVVGAALIGFIYATIFRENIIAISNPQLAFVIISGVASVISQIGDLAASAIKRNYDIKDYGKLIPGHGGILDRFDSIIFIAPIVYMLATIL